MSTDLGFAGRTLLKRIRKSFRLPEHARLAHASVDIGVTDCAILKLEFIVTQKFLDDLAAIEIKDEEEHDK